MLIRVRSNVGVWRVEGLEETTATASDVLEGIAVTRPHVQYEKPLCSDPACHNPIDTTKTLSEQGLLHGSMVHCRVDPTTCADNTKKTAVAADEPQEASNTSAEQQQQQQSGVPMRRVIDKDGSIKLVPSHEPRAPQEDRGFRKGMLPLRDMKMQWTLNEFVALDEQFTFKIKRQESAVCQQVSLDSPSAHAFQAYLQRFQFSRSRFGYLYGKFVTEEDEEGDDEADDDKKKSDDKEPKPKKPTKTIVEAIYEPPQEADPSAAEGFVMQEDPLEDNVNQIAQMLGLTKVGWIFGHAPRDKEDGLVMTAAEVIMTAEMQLEAAQGVEETPYVTVKVTKGSDGNVSVEAFQVSQQCMAMVAEEALEIAQDPKHCKINDTFTAIQEGKESKTVDNNFFLCVVPIVQHTSQTFVSQFPMANRDLDDRTQSHDEMKKQLSKSGTSGWTFLDLLADFQLLVYLSKFLDLNADFPKICQSIVDRSVPLDDGYKLILASMAGMDGSY